MEEQILSESPQASEPSIDSAQTDSTQTAAEQPIEIDNPDRYRYQGRSLKDWENGYMRQSDYTQKTTQIAQERKYYDNLSVDLDRVRSNPHLAEQFRSIYPEKFHGYLRYVLENSTQSPQSPNAQSMTQSQYARLDPNMEMRINQLEKNFRDREVAAISAELDNKFRTLGQKYPFADEEACVARGQALLAKMREADPLNPNVRISDKQWDAIWKGVHDRNYKISDTNYKKQVQAQVQANRKSSDVGRGGGNPGQAPRQFKTVKEATAAALQDIDSGIF